MEHRIIYNTLSRLKKEKNIEYVRFYLYGFFSGFVLSKESFKNNKDIKAMVEEFNLDFKDYIFDSRTLVTSRIIRHIESLDPNELEEFKKKCITYIELKFNSDLLLNKPNIESKTPKNENYVKKIVEKYKRND
ncbi:hypothetical protein [Peribacillus simplex]|uniref:hypothetical protein n=1 Tax=Peribacillus simplex TaxID=1478 RepID=UPI003D268A42